jgi:hypothetical protein
VRRFVDGAFDQPGRAGLVIHAFGGIIVAETKFRKVAVQMLLRDVVIVADNAALQNRALRRWDTGGLANDETIVELKPGP